jgi:hypothetical protein
MVFNLKNFRVAQQEVLEEEVPIQKGDFVAPQDNNTDTSKINNIITQGAIDISGKFEQLVKNISPDKINPIITKTLRNLGNILK